MVITFEVQIDPVKFLQSAGGFTWESDPTVTFTDEQLQEMNRLLFGFTQDLGRFNHYLRSTMYVDGEVYRG